MAFSETSLVRDFLQSLQESIPSSWSVKSTSRSAIGRRFSICGPAGETGELCVTVVRQLYPKDVRNTVDRFRGALPNGCLPIVVAPFLGPRARELVQNAKAGYWDSTGNFRIALEQPALFIERSGADKNPSPTGKKLQSLKGRGAGRAVRALCDFRPPFGIRQLAEKSTTPAPSISRVVELLEREAIVERLSPRGPIVRVDWPALLKRWAADYDFVKSNETASYLEPRGLKTLLAKLPSASLRYAITGTLAADALGAAVSAPRLATIFTDDRTAAADALDLRPADSGGNVLLVEPFDVVVFERSKEKGGLTYASVSQIAVDLLTGPGRSPADGESLLEWMKENERAWRT